MYTARLIFTVIMALVLMGCPPPVSNNPDAPASDPDAPAESTPDPKPKDLVFAQISAGSFHTMILKTNGSLWAFGYNEYGQLGDGTGGADVVQLNPVQVMIAEGQPMTEVKRVSTGSDQTMIIKKGDTLWAVGNNADGQLGDGKGAAGVVQLNPVQVKIDENTLMTEVAQVAAGSGHTMILKKGDTLWAVGNNRFGQLGDGSTANKQFPVQVKIDENTLMTEVAQVAAGSGHTMILKTNGDLWAVGFNRYGQLGDGSTANKQFPVQVKINENTPMIEVDQISVGDEHTVILKENGELWAVGYNTYGQLGDGSTAHKQFPVQVKIDENTPMTEVAQVAAGGNHTVILKENGDLWAVGKNDFGQLGDDSTANKQFPVQVKTADGEPMTNVAQISAGYYHTVILKNDDTLWAVGRNNSGQLGDGSTTNQKTPVEITIP